MDSARPTIMVVDDDPHVCAMLRCVLQDEGYHVVAFTETSGLLAPSGRAAVDLLILDVVLGADDGLAVLNALNTRPLHPPVVILSGRTDRATRLRAFELGALDYMTKPIDIAEFAARVRVALRRAGGVAAGHPARHATS